MKQFLLFYTLTAWAMPLSAQFHQAVHSDLSGQALLNALVQDFKPTVVLDYNTCRDTMYGKIDNVNDSVTCVYSGYRVYVPPTVDPSTYLYMNGSAIGINAEHTFPQSMGALDGNPKSDLHHIFPARAGVNSARNNDPFGEIADNQTETWYYKEIETATIPSQNIDLYSESIGSTIFEPREEHKGNVARAMMYFYTMYKAEADAANTTFFSSQIATLCDWHLLDPVDEREWQRTWAIAQHQGGKANPFVLDCTLAQRSYCSTSALCEVTSTKVVGAWGCELLPAYPNPFADRTVLSYELHRPMQLRLSVHDALGREIALLVQGEQAAGLYQYEWSPESPSAGMYWYQLQLVEGSETTTLARAMLRE